MYLNRSQSAALLDLVSLPKVFQGRNDVSFSFHSKNQQERTDMGEGYNVGSQGKTLQLEGARTTSIHTEVRNCSLPRLGSSQNTIFSRPNSERKKDKSR